MFPSALSKSVDSGSVVPEIDEEVPELSEDMFETTSCSTCSSSLCSAMTSSFCDFEAFNFSLLGAHVNANINIVARRPVRTVTMHEDVRVDCLQGF
jgi:hypothetical protein